MGRAHHAHVDRHRACAAERHHRAFLQHAHQPHLLRERHVADFVEKQRAAVGLRDLAGAAALACAGERAVLVAEQLGLDQRIGQRGAVDGDERAVGARRRLVQRAGEPFLAGARLAEDQQRQVAAADLRDPVEHGSHPCIAGVERRERDRLGVDRARARGDGRRCGRRDGDGRLARLGEFAAREHAHAVDSVNWNGAPGARAACCAS